MVVKLLSLPWKAGECNHPQLSPISDDEVQCIECKKIIKKSEFNLIEQISNNKPSPPFKQNNIGDRCTWECGDGEGGHGVVIGREPYKYWAKCDETGETIEVSLRRHR